MNATVLDNVRAFKAMEKTMDRLENYDIETSRIFLFDFTIRKGRISKEMIRHRRGVEETRAKLNEQLAEHGMQERV